MGHLSRCVYCRDAPGVGLMALRLVAYLSSGTAFDRSFTNGMCPIFHRKL